MSLRSFMKKHENMPILLVFIGMLIAVFLAEFLFVRGGDLSRVAFVRPMNVSNVMMQVSVTGILAIGMTMIMISGGIDLSVGQMVSFIGTMTAWLIRTGGWAPGLAILFGVVVAVAFQVLMGFIISRTKLEPFIVSLGFMSIYRGFVYLITNGRELSIHGQFTFLGQTYFDITQQLRIGMPVVIFVVLVIVMALVFKYTKFGRRVYAVGGNEQAAYLAGINVKNSKLIFYALNGLFVAIASLTLLSRLGTGNPLMGEGREIEVIAAVVVGGTALSGGRGDVVGTLIGVLLLGIISNALNILGVNPHWQYIMRGVLIVAAVLIGYLSSIGGNSVKVFREMRKKPVEEPVEEKQ